MKKASLSLVMCLLAVVMYSQTTLKGKILTSSGNGIENANVVVLESNKGTITDKNGNYAIANLQPKTYFIQVSYIGYATQIKSIKLNEGSNELDIRLVETSNKLEEIVVSGANQRLEKLQRSPISIAAVTTKEIKNLQINSTTELSSIAPNFNTYDDGATGGYTMFVSRGITSIDNNPVVGFYIDDIPYFDAFSFPLTLQDVEQIEVLRGPQGTLYGRNSLAGVIRITSKKPVNDVTGFLKLGAGNLKSRELNFVFNAPLVDDKLFLRANVQVNDRDGYTTNNFLNKKIQNRKTVNSNIQLKYLANEKLSFDALYNVSRREADAYAFAVFYPRAMPKDYLKNPYQFSFDTDVNRVAVTQNVALKTKVHFNDFDLSSVTTYQKTTQEGLDDYDYTPAEIQYGFTENDIENFTQEFKLTSTTDSDLKWNLGALLYKINNIEKRDLRNGKDDPRGQNQILSDNDREQKGFAIYGQATYNFTDDLAITGGLRYDYEETKLDGKNKMAVTGFTPNNINLKTDFNSITSKVALSYQANENSMIFANFAQGYRPGGINPSIRDPKLALFDHENTLNFELGTKNNFFNNRLKFNLTGFFVAYKDQQIYTLVDLANFVFGTDNIGKSQNYGVELESKFAVTKGLTLGLNLGYLKSEIKKYNEVIVDPITYAVSTVSREGNSLIFVPKFNGNANLQLVQPVSKKLNIEASVDYRYQSKVYIDLANEVDLDPYGILNGRIGVTSKHLDFFIWGKNITDEAYFSYGYGASSYRSATYGLPLTFGANATIKF